MIFSSFLSFFPFISSSSISCSFIPIPDERGRDTSLEPGAGVRLGGRHSCFMAFRPRRWRSGLFLGTYLLSIYPQNGSRAQCLVVVLQPKFLLRCACDRGILHFSSVSNPPPPLSPGGPPREVPSGWPRSPRTSGSPLRSQSTAWLLFLLTQDYPIMGDYHRGCKRLSHQGIVIVSNAGYPAPRRRSLLHQPEFILSPTYTQLVRPLPGM